jgi:hypothetical protein
MEAIGELLIAFAFFGAVFVCPLVYMLMKHQRAMAEMLHRGAGSEGMQRLEALEREVRELKAVRHERILTQDDQRELSRHITE